MRGNWGKLSKAHGLLLLAVIVVVPFAIGAGIAATEAPTGFDNVTNGFTTQTVFDEDRAVFEGREEADEGLGPVYNAQACAECHQTPVTGGVSQITELRAGIFNGATFTDHVGGSLVNDRAIDASIQEVVLGVDNVVALRSSLNVLGDGFVEAIADTTLASIRAAQPTAQRGTLINVPVLEKSPPFNPTTTTRAARFGWKNQHASLLSFSADAYVNEMGITSPLQPNENTSNGVSVAAFDAVADPEEAPTPANPFGPDVEFFARFMRATKAPQPDLTAQNSADGQAGKALFSAIGCNVCHTPSITTAPAGTAINGGTFIIPAALGDKTIHPYGDFLLHDIGTGDGIVQNGGQGTRNQLRTSPLWGLRTKSRLLHDHRAFTRNNAIAQFHFGQATAAGDNYFALSTTQKNQLITFINSL